MNEDEFAGMFIDAEKDNQSTIIKGKSYVEKVIEKAEQEFNGYSEEHQSRQDERDSLAAKIKTLQSRLRKCKNSRVPSQLQKNAQLAEKRRKIRAKIEFCKMRLGEINMEEEGPEER